MKVINIQNLSYSINKKRILKNIHFSIEKNERVALLGSNGSGKSTIIDVIVDNFSPSSGQVNVFESVFKDHKRKIGVLYDNSPFFPALKVHELISFTSSIYNIKERDNAIIDQLKDSLGISNIEQSLFHALSKGERKKVGVILSLIHDPTLLIADEPTSFLDPSMRNAYWRILSERKDLTVLFTTHLWEEAQRYADKVVFINDGEQLFETDTISNFLSDKYLNGDKKIVVDGASEVERLLPEATIVTYNDQHHIFSRSFKATLDTIQNSVKKYSLLEKSLEDIYHYLIVKQKQ